MIGTRDHDLCLGKYRLPVTIDQSSGVISVQMGKDDRVDLRWVMAGCLHVFDDVAKRGSEQAGGTGIDQNEMRAGVDQIRIDGCLHFRVADKRAR